MTDEGSIIAEFSEHSASYRHASEIRREPSRATAQKSKLKFPLERWDSITFDGREEWTIKRLFPRKGLAAVYGRPGSFKSFVAFDIGRAVAQGDEWAGRRVNQAPVVYIAAEGAEGLRKRKVGLTVANDRIPRNLPFTLISAAPNLGTDKSELPELISAIESAGIAPGLIIIDTLAQSLGSGDENGTGMTAFVANVSALAARFDCLVLIVHHVGLGDEKRMRGHSSLNGALDAQLLCERCEGELAATLTLQKLKDDSGDVRLVARLSRVVIGYDEDGDEFSTLIVVSVADSGPATRAPRAKIVPRSQRLLMACVEEAIAEAGESFMPFGAGHLIRGVFDKTVRARYFERIAEQAEPDEDKDKLFDRQRKGFNRAIDGALRSQMLGATEREGERFVWLP